MSTTDELREWWLHKFPVMDKELHKDFNAIADRIDAEYQKAIRELNNLADASMPIPVDADGVPIRVGDVLTDDAEFKSEGNVECLMFDESGWMVGFGKGWTDVRIHEWHHYHAQTVEDVLREFAEKMNENLGMYTGEAIDADEWRDADNKTIAEYAKRLTLAEGEDA